MEGKTGIDNHLTEDARPSKNISSHFIIFLSVAEYFLLLVSYYLVWKTVFAVFTIVKFDFSLNRRFLEIPANVIYTVFQPYSHHGDILNAVISQLILVFCYFKYHFLKKRVRFFPEMTIISVQISFFIMVFSMVLFTIFSIFEVPIGNLK